MCKLSKNIVSIKAKILDCYINDNYGCLAFLHRIGYPI